ncbi:hypothetical protein ACTL6U_17275 [Rhodovibrionaceae bacterium A322]
MSTPLTSSLNKATQKTLALTLLLATGLLLAGCVSISTGHSGYIKGGNTIDRCREEYPTGGNARGGDGSAYSCDHYY